jgi:hypothetical protein
MNGKMQRWLAGPILHLSGRLTDELCASDVCDLQCYGAYGYRVVAERRWFFRIYSIQYIPGVVGVVREEVCEVADDKV